MTQFEDTEFSDILDALNFALHIQKDQNIIIKVWSDFYPIYYQNKKHLVSHRIADHQRIGKALAGGCLRIHYNDPDINSLIAEDALFFLTSDYFNNNNSYVLPDLYNLLFYNSNFLIDRWNKIYFNIPENITNQYYIINIINELNTIKSYDRGKYILSNKMVLMSLLVRIYIIKGFCTNYVDRELKFDDSVFEMTSNLSNIQKDFNVYCNNLHSLSQLGFTEDCGENWLKEMYLDTMAIIKKHN